MVPMHRSHAGHETSTLKSPIVQGIERVFPVPNRRHPLRVDGEILIPVKPPHLLDRNS